MYCMKARLEMTQVGAAPPVSAAGRWKSFVRWLWVRTLGSVTTAEMLWGQCQDCRPSRGPADRRRGRTFTSKEENAISALDEIAVTHKTAQPTNGS